MRLLRRGHLLAIALVLLAASGCAEKGQYRGVQNSLDRALWYYEVDRLNRSHAISDERVPKPMEPKTENGSWPRLSGEDKRRLEEQVKATQEVANALEGLRGRTPIAAPAKPGPVLVPERRDPSRVPSPALVDVDSQIHVLVNKEALVSAPDWTLAKKQRDELLARKTKIQKALLALGTYIETRKTAIQLYGAGDQAAFIKARRAFGAAEQTLIDTYLGELWNEASPEYATLEAAFKNLSQDPEMTALREFLQGRINAIEAGDQALMKDLQQNLRTLRLEAQVAGTGKDPLFLHLEGYDTREQGGFQARDRCGLNLSAADRKDLEQHMNATRDIAKNLEDVRTKKISFQEAVAKAGPFLSAPLAADIAEIKGLIAAYSPAEIQKKLTDMSQAFERLVDKAKASAVPDNVKAQLLGMPERFKGWLKGGGIDTLTQLAVVIDSVEKLRVRWQDVTHQDQTALLLDTAAAFGQLRGVLSNPRFSGTLRTSVADFVKAESGTLAEQAQTTLVQLANSDEFKGLQAQLSAIPADFAKMWAAAQRICGQLGVFREATTPLSITAPGTLDVPLDEVRDTSIDLRRVPLSPGDEITLRATLKQGQREIDTSTASFKAERLGWYANLSPSVVLAKPTELAGGENDFRFAPALSWLHHYVPRPEEEGWYTGPLRVLDPAIGLHAIFLCFDSPGDDDAIQIGLGGTLSLWKERLQFGAGFNLMADSEDEGRYYFFVGTDLIGLLQTVTGQPAR